MKLPSAIESENAVIGAIIMDPPSFHLTNLTDSDFHDGKNRATYNALRRMLENGPLDSTVIQVNLKALGIISSFTETSRWTECAPSSAMIEHHSSILRKVAGQRKLLEIGHKLMKGEYDEEPHVAAARAIEELSGASDCGGEKDSPHCFEFLEEFLSTTTHPVIPTEIGVLDNAIGGGLHVGGTVMLGGDSGAGKTMLALCFVRNCVKRMVPCYMVSRDQTERDIMAKLFAGAFGIPRPSLKTDPRSSAFKQIARDWPLWFYPRSKSFDVDSVCAEIKINVATHGVRVWVMDYLQRIELRGYPELKADHARYEKVANKLADLAQDTKTCGVLISRVTKPSQNTQTQHRFSGGAGIQNACDDMMFVHRHDFDDESKAQIFGKGGMRIIEMIGKRNFTGGFIDLKVDYPFDRYSEYKDWSIQERAVWDEEKRGK